MLSIPFIKAQGLGNDFVILESPTSQSLETLYPRGMIRHMADRRLGIGCDQIIIYHRSSRHDVNVIFFNGDGTEALACGNGSRALISYLFQENLIESPVSLHTKGGILLGEKSVHLDGTFSVLLTFPSPTLVDREDLAQLPEVQGQQEKYIFVTIGNPHLICFIESLDTINIDSWGPILSTHPIFKSSKMSETDDVNVSFVEYRAPDHLYLKVWERGAGYTGACGTAACAAFAALKAIIHTPITDTIQVHQKGGDLQLTWTDHGIKMSGPTKTVFKGEFDYFHEE